MFYNLIKTPVILKTGNNIIGKIDSLLRDAHLIYLKKILITQENLYTQYKQSLDKNDFSKVVFVKGGYVEEAAGIMEQFKDEDALIIAFGGGSVLDIVKYCASKMDKAYITIPSTLSNDAIYSCVARLTCAKKKTSYGVQPPIGIIVDLEIIRQSPKHLLLAGVADLISNLSAIQDWLLAYNNINEPINELAYMLAKEAAIPILHYKESDLLEDRFLLDLVNGLVTSGLSMIISGNTRGTSGSEHLISHAIDEFFPERSSIHGLQVGWAHMLIDRKYRSPNIELAEFFYRMGLVEVIKDTVLFDDKEFEMLIPYALKVRNRYTIFNSRQSLYGF